MSCRTPFAPVFHVNSNRRRTSAFCCTTTALKLLLNALNALIHLERVWERPQLVASGRTYARLCSEMAVYASRRNEEQLYETHCRHSLQYHTPWPSSKDPPPPPLLHCPVVTIIRSICICTRSALVTSRLLQPSQRMYIFLLSTATPERPL